MSEIKKLSARMAAPVRVKINLNDENWDWVMEHGATHPKLINEDGEYFTVQYPTRFEYEQNLEKWCGMVCRIEEVPIT